MADEARNMQLFLLKQKKFALLSALLQAYYDAQNADDLRMEGCVALHFKQYAKAEKACRQLLHMQPHDEQAIRSLAQACFHQAHLRRRPSITGLCWRCIPTTATAPSTCRSHFSTVARPTRRGRCSSSSIMSIPTTST